MMCHNFVELIAASLALLMCVSIVWAQHTVVTFGRRLTDQTAPCDEYSYYRIEVTSPCDDLRVQVDVEEGEPNLYVSKGPNEFPTYSSLAWSSYEWGSEDLVISSWDPEFTIGTYYIGVHGYCGEDVATKYTDSKYSLYVTSVPTTHPHSEISINSSISGTLSVNGYQYFKFCVSSSCSNVEVRLTNCVDPVDCPDSYAWPELLVSRAIEEPTISDHAWKLASVAKRSINLTHNDPDFYPGHYFVGVYGWCTPTDDCLDPRTCGPCVYAQDHPYNVSVTVEPVTMGCVPKKPLELCEGGGASALNTSLLMVALISASLAYNVC